VRLSLGRFIALNYVAGFLATMILILAWLS
jgi:hypothetical protein